MGYLETARKAYSQLGYTDFKKLIGSYSKDYDKVLASIEKKFGFDELRKSYMDDIKVTIDNYLPFFKDELHQFLKLKEVTYYQRNIPLRTFSLLMWIWEKKLNISQGSLDHFVNSIFLGTFGYKMLDFSTDNKNAKPEFGLVGFYAVKLAEKLLSDALGRNNTNEAIINYFKMYIDTELFEKKNRWKSCPFSWDEAKRLGHKGAPVYIVQESLFRFAGYDEDKIKDLINSLIYVSAAIQLVDDIADAKEDLLNGYETLVMKDYYQTFGVDDITDDKINQILNQDRLKLIYKTGQELFDMSRKLFEKHDEFVIQLSTELWNFNFTTLFEIS